MDQKDEKPGQHQLLGGSDVPTTAKRFSTTTEVFCKTLLSLQPEAVGAPAEVTKRLKPLM
jgi:hypothetical protein